MQRKSVTVSFLHVITISELDIYAHTVIIRILRRAITLRLLLLHSPRSKKMVQTISFRVKNTNICFLVAAVFAASMSHAGVVIVPGWGSPVFQEEFSGNTVDQSIWQVGNWANDANGEAQYYHPDQVTVWNDSLHLRADYDPNWTYGRQYNSGLVRTWQEWSYGRFEVRANLPNGQGFWPAIWLLPRSVNWPTGGEIDIMEARGDQPYTMSSALHWGYDSNSRQYRSEIYESGANFQEGYHDYAVEWEVGTVRFYVDGVEHMTLYEPDVGIPGTPKSLILNLAVGGNYSGYPDATTPFPNGFDIDYVRVWQRPEIIAPPTSILIDPGFEEGDGAMSNWSVFGNIIENVSSDYGTPLDGVRSLKLYGQFIDQENFSGASQNISIQGGTHITASAHSLTRSEDAITGTNNSVVMKIEYYSQAGAEYDSEFFLGESQITLADGNSNVDEWSYGEITDQSPTNAVEARVAFVFIQPATNDLGSVFVDSVMLFETLAGDYNDDGVVDAADYTVWRDNLGAVEGSLPNDIDGGSIGNAQYSTWQANYGLSTNTVSTASSTAVPEPPTLLVFGIAISFASLIHRNRSSIIAN